MAYIYKYNSAQEAADIDALTIPLAEHQSGDLLIVFAGKDDGTGGSLSFSGTGWTEGRQGLVGSTGSNSGRAGWWWKWATSSSESSPTVSSTDPDTWTGFAMTIRDAHYNAGSPSDFIDVENSNTDVAGPPYDATALTTNYNNSLYIIMSFHDATVPAMPDPGITVIDSEDAIGNGQSIAWTIIPTAGTTGQVSYYGLGTSDESLFFKLAIRNAVGGKVPSYSNRDVATIVTTHTHRLASATAESFESSAGWRGHNIRNPLYVFRDDAGVFTDITTPATDDTDADVSFSATEAVNDAIYIGDSAPFYGVSFDRAGCTAGTAGVLVYEYWDGSTWKSVANKAGVTIPNLTSTTLADAQGVGWTPASDWTTTTVNGQSAYWIRMRITTVYTINPTVSRIYIGDKVSFYDAGGAVADTGILPFYSSAGTTPSSTGNLWVGSLYNFGKNNDVSASGKYLLGTYLFSSPRQYYNCGDQKRGGGVMELYIDSSGNYKAWRIGGYGDAQTKPDARNYYIVQPSQVTDTSWIGSTTPFDKTALRKQGILTSVLNGSTVVYYSTLYLINKMVLSGGTSAIPFNFADFQTTISGNVLQYNAYGTYLIPIQFGGENPISCDMELFTITFPKVAIDGTSMYHIDKDILGVIVDARAGDVVKLRNGTITGESRYRFEFTATASASATYDFSGLVVVNANVTLRPVHTFSEMTFIGCPIFTQNGAYIDGCSLTDTKISSATPADAAKISNTHFTSGGTGHAIEISGTAANISLAGNTFEGYAVSDGSTGNEAIFVNIATGSMTISITNGGNTPSIRTAGCTVTVQNAVTVEVLVLDIDTNAPVENARVLLEAGSGGDLTAGTDILTGLTNASGIATTSFAYTNDQPVIGRVRRATTGYGTLYKTAPISGEITSAGFSTTVFLIPDE